MPVPGVDDDGDFPTANELDAWLGQGSHSWTLDELDRTLAVELAAQSRVCRVPAVYPADLRDALLRRSARNLEMRRQLTEQPRTDADFPSANLVPPGRDQEVRRLEAPWRRVTFG